MAAVAATKGGGGVQLPRLASSCGNTATIVAGQPRLVASRLLFVADVATAFLLLQQKLSYSHRQYYC